MMTSQRRRVATAFATLAIGFVAVRLAEAQQSSSATSAPSRFAFDEMVQTGISDLGGERVKVNVPGMVHLTVDRRPNKQGARLDLTVLSGMVRVNLDRVHNPNGRNEGPIDVRVFGIPVYRNQAARDGTSPREPSPLNGFTDSIPRVDSLPNMVPLEV